MLYTIIVNWNGWRDTVECLESLFAAQHHGLTVVVCDNASPDDSVARLRAWAMERLGGDPPTDLSAEIERAKSAQGWDAPPAPGAGRFRFVLAEMESNAGFAGGNNVGITYALRDPACAFVFLLNNDAAIYPDTLIHLEAKMARCSSVALCGPTLVHYDQRQVVQGIGGIYHKFNARAVSLYSDRRLNELPSEAEGERGLNYVIGAAMFARASLFRRLGGLNEVYFLYYEELDLSRHLLADEKIGWAKDALVAHKVGASIGTGYGGSRPSDLAIYYDHRSKVRYYATYLRAYLPFLLLKLAKTSFAYARKRDFRAVRIIWLAVGDYLSKPAAFRRVFSTVRGGSGGPK